MRNSTRELFVEGCLPMVLIWGLIFGGFYFYVRSAQDAAKSSSTTPAKSSTVIAESDEGYGGSTKVEEPSQVRERQTINPEWPTTDDELLAVPEENRWYTSYYHIGETHTVVGPVVEVHQALNEEGQPIFVDIGKAYPSPGRFTVVIWAEDLDSGLLEMVNAVDDGNAWLSITGYISSYDDVPQMTSGDGPLDFTWYTNVK